MYDMEILDVERGCGNLVDGGYYLSGAGCFAPNGAFHVVAYPFGDGLDDVVYCGKSVPARGMLEINPAATFARLSVVVPGAEAITPFEQVLYDNLVGKLGKRGLIDHVGSEHYSPTQFINELVTYGPNRRVRPDVARQLAPYLPVVVVFTHSDIPVFRNTAEIETALDLCQQAFDLFDPDDQHLGANWKRPAWGCYAASGQQTGSDHFMLPLLGLREKVYREWEYLQGRPFWERARQYFEGLQYEEQPFAISWFLRAIRVVDEENPLTPADQKAGVMAARKREAEGEQ